VDSEEVGRPEHTLGQTAESYGGGLKGVNRRKLPLASSLWRGLQVS